MVTEGTLLVVGTGIQWGGQTTLAARRAIEGADRVLFAVVDPWSARWIRSLNPAAESLPYGPVDGPRRKIYAEMVERILAEVRKGQRVCAVFYGHPGVFTEPAHEAIRRARDEGFSARMLPGVSALSCLFADLGVDPGPDGCHIYEATDFLLRGRACDAHTPLILFQIGMIGHRGVFDAARPERIRRGLTVLSEALCQRYPPEHEAVIYEAAAQPVAAPRADRVTLADLPGASVSDISTLYVPPRARAAVDARMLARLGMEPPQGEAEAAARGEVVTREG